MANNSKIDIAAWSAIILGLVLGFMLKRVRFGMLFGLILGAIIVFLINKKRAKNK
jgi:uncharacterized protein YqgC (DUF456 family)